MGLEIKEILRKKLEREDKDFNVNQDVNASDFTSGEVDITRCESIYYGLSGTGDFDLKIEFTDGSGTVLDTVTINSSDGSEISGSENVISKNVQITVTDTSASSNTVTGSIYVV